MRVAGHNYHGQRVHIAGSGKSSNKSRTGHSTIPPIEFILLRVHVVVKKESVNRANLLMLTRDFQSRLKQPRKLRDC